MTPEGITKQLVKDWCKKYNLWYVMQVPSAYGNSTGTSDFQILHKGLFIAIECKKATDKKGPTKKQLEYMENVEINGGRSFLVRNQEDLDRITKELNLDR